MIFEIRNQAFSFDLLLGSFLVQFIKLGQRYVQYIFIPKHKALIKVFPTHKIWSELHNVNPHQKYFHERFMDKNLSHISLIKFNKLNKRRKCIFVANQFNTKTLKAEHKKNNF